VIKNHWLATFLVNTGREGVKNELTVLLVKQPFPFHATSLHKQALRCPALCHFILKEIF